MTKSVKAVPQVQTIKLGDDVLDITLVAVNKLITSLKRSEALSKGNIEKLVQTLLRYVPNTMDVESLNRMLAICSPVNRKAVALFMQSHLEWSFDNEANRFGKRCVGDKKLARIQANRVEFIRSGMTFWQWVDREVKVEAKPKDYSNMLTKLVEKALKEGDYQIDMDAVISAIILGGVTVDKVINAASSIEADLKAA